MFTLSTFFDELFLVVMLPLFFLIYAIAPQKAKKWVLLLSGYAVFWAFSGKLLVYLLLSTVSVFYLGLWLSKIQAKEKSAVVDLSKEEKKLYKKKSRKKQNYVVALTALLHIGTLAFLKYSPFAAKNLNSLFEAFDWDFRFSIARYALPIGISFYTLQAISYIVDIYRKKIKADNNIFRLALYMSFFPQILEGPICRYSDTAEQLWEAPKATYENFLLGLQRIAYGIFKKFLIADRLNIYIKNVFTDYEQYDGFVIAVSAVLYTLQLYCEFSGTIDLVLGSAQFFGIKLPENFKRPFFSISISEFWKRWHITLGTWFKDYVFYPISMSKPIMKLTTKSRKKYGKRFAAVIASAVSLFFVWYCNGVWHGVGWNYIFFGMYHFILILLENIFEPTFYNLSSKYKINRNALPYRIFQMVRTALLVCVGELFFRAHGLKAGLIMFKKIFTDFTLQSLKDQSFFKIGMDKYDFIIVFITVIFLLIIGIMQERGIKIREQILKQNIYVRFAIYYAFIIFIVIFGAYGRDYLPVDPIYANF